MPFSISFAVWGRLISQLRSLSSFICKRYFFILLFYLLLLIDVNDAFCIEFVTITFALISSGILFSFQIISVGCVDDHVPYLCVRCEKDIHLLSPTFVFPLIMNICPAIMWIHCKQHTHKIVLLSDSDKLIFFFRKASGEKTTTRK